MFKNVTTITVGGIPNKESISIEVKGNSVDTALSKVLGSMSMLPWMKVDMNSMYMIDDHTLYLSVVPAEEEVSITSGVNAVVVYTTEARKLWKNSHSSDWNYKPYIDGNCLYAHKAKRDNLSEEDELLLDQVLHHITRTKDFLVIKVGEEDINYRIEEVRSTSYKKVLWNSLDLMSTKRITTPTISILCVDARL
jgi:hypothetical protein